MIKRLLCLLFAVFLSGCATRGQEFPQLELPAQWQAEAARRAKLVETAGLQRWWIGFDDQMLNTLVELTLDGSPDRQIAESRIAESRGLQRTANSSLFPQVGINGSAGRGDEGVVGADNFYDIRFDASFEIDVFGKNRKNVESAEATVAALEAEYHDISLTLIGEVARSYITYRGFQKQVIIAQNNLELQQKTLELVRQQFQYGEAPQLDVERSERLVNTTRASIPEFQRLADNSRLQLSVLTGVMPQELMTYLSQPADIPGVNVTPVLMAPAEVLQLRPDIRAASANLAASTVAAESVTAELFPSFTLSGLYGIAENTLTSATGVWNVTAGIAYSLLDFGRIEGRIDSARAREAQAYHLYRRTVIETISEVETALIDSSAINKQRVILQKALQNAKRAFILSENLYREGEISFLDVLDAQRTVNEADAALVTAQSAQAESLVRLYKSLGVY